MLCCSAEVSRAMFSSLDTCGRLQCSPPPNTLLPAAHCAEAGRDHVPAAARTVCGRHRAAQAAGGGALTAAGRQALRAARQCSGATHDASSAATAGRACGSHPGLGACRKLAEGGLSCLVSCSSHVAAKFVCSPGIPTHMERRRATGSRWRVGHLWNSSRRTAPPVPPGPNFYTPDQQPSCFLAASPSGLASQGLASQVPAPPAGTR